MTASGILIVGAGPAGMAAAVSAAQSGKQVTVLDDNPSEGGQIWRGGKHHPSDSQAARWFQKFRESGAKVIAGSSVIGGDAHNRNLRVETFEDHFDIQYDELILATGARELFLPFPGWTLPNVMGVGGLQALVKSGLTVRGKKIVVAGSGPLLLAVAAYLRKHGAIVPMIAEQTDWNRLVSFVIGLAQHPGKLMQAAALKISLGFTSYSAGAWVTAAEGSNQVTRVHVRTGTKTRTIDCDYLAVAYGFSPNTELPQFLGCRLKDGYIDVDCFQRTSIPAILCAGEITGLGGVDLSLVEGQIAGFTATGRQDLAENLFTARDKARSFAKRLNRTFALSRDLQQLPDAQTIVCRCEDVPFGKLKEAHSWRSAKLHLRCGMGPCQGRICGPAVEYLLGWKPESVRPPVFPARISSLISRPIQQVEESIHT